MNSAWSWENIPKYFTSSIKMLSNALEHIITIFCHAMHCVAYVCPVIYLFSPHICFLSVDPMTVVDPEIDYTTEDPVSSAEQPGKQNPLDHSNIAHSFSLLHALDSGSDILFR